MLILKEECKKLGFSVADLVHVTEVPEQTLRDWCKSRPIMMDVLFSGLAANNILDEIENLRCAHNISLLRDSESEA